MMYPVVTFVQVILHTAPHTHRHAYIPKVKSIGFGIGCCICCIISMGNRTGGCTILRSDCMVTRHDRKLGYSMLLLLSLSMLLLLLWVWFPFTFAVHESLHFILCICFFVYQPEKQNKQNQWNHTLPTIDALFVRVLVVRSLLVHDLRFLFLTREYRILHYVNGCF